VIAQTYDPVEIVKTIEATYGSNFKTTSWLYNKQKKTITLSAQASSFEYAIEQVAKIKGVKGVVDVTYPGIDKSSDGDGVELGLSIKLK
jgi:hypothetical protein